MSKNEQKFQKAFLLQVRETLRGNYSQASKARNMVNYYKRKLDDRN